MNMPLRRPMSLDEFLEWEARQDVKHEFDGLHVVAMAGGTVAHAILQANLSRVLGNALRGTPCRVYGSDLKIEVAGSIRYPDAFVACTPIAPGATVIRDPVVVFEVLSPSTASTDRIQKNQEYRDTPSIRRYVMLEQDAVGATVFARDGDGWTGRVLGPGAMLALPEIGVEFRLNEVYEGLERVERQAAAN